MASLYGRCPGDTFKIKNKRRYYVSTDVIFTNQYLLMSIYTPRISFVYLNNVTFNCIISYCLSMIAFCTIKSTLLLGLNAQSALASKSFDCSKSSCSAIQCHYSFLLWMIILVTLNLGKMFPVKVCPFPHILIVKMCFVDQLK